MNYLETAQNSLKSFRDETDNRIIVVGQNTIIRNFIPRWINKIEQKVHNARWSLKTESVELSIHSFLYNKIDFLICYKNNDIIKKLDKTKHDYTIVGHETLVPVVKSDGHYTDVKLSEGHKDMIPFLAYSPESFFGIEVNKIIKSNFSLKTIFDHSFSNVLYDMVRQDRGVAWLPLSSIQGDLDNNILKIVGGKSLYLQLDIILCSYKHYQNPLHREIARVGKNIKI